MTASSADGRCAVAGELYHGIPCRVRIAGAEGDVQAAWQELCGIDGTFNVHRPDSELARINAAGPGAYRVSAGLAACLEVAAAVEGLSGGAWSPCLLPAVRLWREAARCGRAPAATDLAAAVAAIPGGWSLDGDRLAVLRPGIAFDLGGIAKGFAVDRAVAVLRARGVQDLLVQVGGETACLGAAASDGRVHRIGIPHPDDPEGAWCAVLRDPGAGLCGSTSGDYRLGHTVAGVRHHHLLDARTGMPVAHGVASATCVFRGLGRNALADGLSGAITVCGSEGLAGLCAAVGAEGLVLRRDPGRGLRAAMTPGWTELEADGGGG